MTQIPKHFMAALLPYRESRGHMLRVYGYMNILCCAFFFRRQSTSLPKTLSIDIAAFSVYHDIGKGFVPKDILNYPGKLDLGGMRLICRHPDLGIGALDNFCEQYPEYRAFCQNRVLRNIVLFHHERFDGKGYPLHLAGADIPLESRLMALVDVYDAMVSPRCYKESYTSKSVAEYIMDMRESFFDPDIADIFWTIRQDFFILTEKNLRQMQDSLSSRIL